MNTLVKNRFTPKSALSMASGQPKHGQEQRPDDITGAIAQRKNYGVLVHLAAMGCQPDVTDPVEQQRADQQQQVLLPVELPHLRTVDVKGEHEHSQKAAHS